MGKFIAKYNYNLDFQHNQDANYWYIAGLMAADGYVSDESVQLTLNKRDLHILESIRDIVCPGKPLLDKARTNAYSLKLDNTVLAKHYKELFSMVSNQKHLELIFPEIPDEYTKEFIRGYVDGDGTIGATKAKKVFENEIRRYPGIRLRILGNQEFLTEMTEKIRGFIPNKTYAVIKKGKENVYVVTYNFSVATKILDWLYEDSPELYLERKYKKYRELTQPEDIV